MVKESDLVLELKEAGMPQEIINLLNKPIPIKFSPEDRAEIKETADSYLRGYKRMRELCKKINEQYE